MLYILPVREVNAYQFLLFVVLSIYGKKIKLWFLSVSKVRSRSKLLLPVFRNKEMKTMKMNYSAPLNLCGERGFFYHE